MHVCRPSRQRSVNQQGDHYTDWSMLVNMLRLHRKEGIKIVK